MYVRQAMSYLCNSAWPQSQYASASICGVLRLQVRTTQSFLVLDFVRQGEFSGDAIGVTGNQEI